MNGLVRLGASILLILLSACGTLQISVEGTPTTDAAATSTVSALQAQNARLATQVAVLNESAGNSTPIARESIASSGPPSTGVPPATRITFLNGSSVGVVSAPIAAGQTQSYVVDVFQAQPMYVYVASANSDVTVSIATESGAAILSPAAKKISWQGSLSKAGDYFLAIHGGASTENFTLTVTIPWRLQFSPGADSATLSGKTVAGYNVSYTLFATKGQTMSVDLEQLSSKASLAIYGFTDGQRYLSSDKGQKSYQFVLPSAQDYIIVIVPMPGLEVSYTMTIKVQ